MRKLTGRQRWRKGGKQRKRERNIEKGEGDIGIERGRGG
jgi:hypothetical protein